MSTPRDRYMSKSYRDPKSHTESVDYDDVLYEDSVSSDTDFDVSDPYDCEYDR